MKMASEIRKESRWITCNCGARWTALGAAHCGSCHETFSGSTLFDAHRTAHGDRGTCRNPEDIRTATGYRVMFFRDGLWRGPEDPDAAARWGR